MLKSAFAAVGWLSVFAFRSMADLVGLKVFLQLLRWLVFHPAIFLLDWV
jgi:hypothetical protein